MTELQKPKGLTSTKETWSLAIKYVAERKRIEEALGFILKLGEIAAEGNPLRTTLAALKKRVVPYLADVVYFDFQGAGVEAEVETNPSARIPEATVARLAKIAAAMFAEAPADATHAKNSVDLAREPGEVAVKGEGAFVRVPLRFRGYAYGSLTLVKCTDDVPKYSKAHVAMAEAFARTVASTLYLHELERRR